MLPRIVNKQAYFDYQILKTFQAGIALLGLEVKAVKSGHLLLAGAFVALKNGSAWLLNATIPPYQAKNTPLSYDPNRSRRLLLRKDELKELVGLSSQKGLTILPLEAYTKHNLIKVLIGVGRHKKKVDKREIIKKRETKREIARELKRG